MTIKSLIILTLLSIYSFSSDKEHEGHNHAKGSHIYYGEILSIENAMGYKYLKVKEDGKELWVAIANAPVKIGEKIGYDKNTIMKNFKSKSLNRTFKEIIFASDVYLAEKNTTPVKDLKDMLGLSPTKENTKIIEKKASKLAKKFVKKEFYTVEEIFMWKDALKNQNIKVKGKISKISKQIMKVDWVHIQDGTGNKNNNNEDLVFTVKEMQFKAGDKLIATGKLIVDKDFGYGYFYPVIIQESSFKKN